MGLKTGDVVEIEMAGLDAAYPPAQTPRQCEVLSVEGDVVTLANEFAEDGVKFSSSTGRRLNRDDTRGTSGG